SLNRRLQLTNVPRPRIGNHSPNGFFGQFQRLAPVTVDSHAQEAFSQKRNVRATLAESWNSKRYDTETIIEIFSKRSSLNLMLEIPIGSSNNSSVDSDRASCAHASNLSLL